MNHVEKEACKKVKKEKFRKKSLDSTDKLSRPYKKLKIFDHFIWPT